MEFYNPSRKYLKCVGQPLNLFSPFDNLHAPDGVAILGGDV
jgi:hypothetical protein